ncbi:hypothetical protein HAX54_030630, partial [Datura stramonium]|nr:hypothetical protein [Datura stramonium]
ASFKAPTYEVDALRSTVPQADYMWRIILMAGTLPALLTYYWRMKMHETARYNALVAKNVQQATVDMERVMQVDIGIEQKEPAVSPAMNLARSRNNFQNLFQKDIFSAVGWIPVVKTMSAIEEQPYWVRGPVFTDLLLANFGPNATIFVMPAEIFPARLRSTCHGISAAFGKLGAMPQDKTKADAGYPAGIGVRNSLIVLGVVNLLGTFFTFLVPKFKGKPLKEMSGGNDDSA